MIAGDDVEEIKVKTEELMRLFMTELQMHQILRRVSLAVRGWRCGDADYDAGDETK